MDQFGQSTFRPTFPQPIRRKCRAGARVMTAPDVGLDVRSEGEMWGMPHKRALFGPEGHDSVSSVSGGPDDEFPEEAWSPRVDLADVVACLQKEVEEFRSESGYGGSRRSAIPPNPRAGPGLHQLLYPCLRERLVGTSIGKCLRPLLVPMGGTV